MSDRCAAARLRRELNSSREGLIESLSLASYLMRVNYTSRLLRECNATSLRELAEVFERIGTTAETYLAATASKSQPGPADGRFFAASRKRLRDVTARLDGIS